MNSVEFFSKALLVFAGAGLGGVLRYGAATLIHRRIQGSFPWGTFAVNVTGCFAMGALTALLDAGSAPSEGVTAFFLRGLLGGYTTFSAYGGEIDQLLEQRQAGRFTAYAAGSLLACLAAVGTGRLLMGRPGF
jgi:CrcB protein